MCYFLYMSTSSSEDLTKHNSELVRFKRPEPADEKWTALLRHEHKWFVGSKSECSCTFRHFSTTDLGFTEPQNWFPEEEDSVRATAELYRVIHGLLFAGEHVDCLDAWYDAKRDEIKDLVVTLSTVSEKGFLLFENHHLLFEQ
jgi:hypothetical protein